MRRLLAAQLARPVRFVEQVEAMYASGARTFVEVGPGAVLTGLVGKILAGRPHRAINLDARGHGCRHGISPGPRAALRGRARDGPGAALGRVPAAAGSAGTAPPRRRDRHLRDELGKPYPPAGGAAALPPPNAELAVPAPGAAACGSRAPGRPGGVARGVSRAAARDRRGAHGLAGDDDPDPPRVPAVGGALLRRAGAGRGAARGGFQSSASAAPASSSVRSQDGRCVPVAGSRGLLSLRTSVRLGAVALGSAAARPPPSPPGPRHAPRVVAEKTGYPVDCCAGDGARGRPRHRLRQAGRDPLGAGERLPTCPARAAA